MGFGVPAALTALTGPMTVELWARLDALPTGTSRGTLFSRGLLSGASSPGLICVESTGKMLFQGGFKSSTSSSYLARKLVSNAALSTGTWTHLALVRDTANLALRWYVDGVLDSAVQLTGVTGLAGAGTATLTWLGQASGGGDPFQGALAEVRVWSAARTAEEIAASRKVRVPGSTPNLVAGWSLHEGAGATVGDRGPFAITGTMTGATWADVGDQAGLTEPLP